MKDEYVIGFNYLTSYAGRGLVGNSAVALWRCCHVVVSNETRRRCTVQRENRFRYRLQKSNCIEMTARGKGLVCSYSTLRCIRSGSKYDSRGREKAETRTLTKSKLENAKSRRLRVFQRAENVKFSKFLSMKEAHTNERNTPPIAKC